LVVAALAFAVILPGMVVFCAYSAAQLGDQWLETFRPRVYLQGESGEAEAKELAGELRGWSSVEAVDVRPPTDAHEAARERIGDEELAEVGVESSMFPYSLAVVPASRWGNDVELVSRIRGLETREFVETVDVPSQRVGRVLSWLDWVVIGGMVSLLAALGLATWLLGTFLRRIRRARRRQLSVLERFGAEPGELRRGTWVRGLTIGTWAGIVAFVCLLGIGIAWRAFIDGFWQPLSVGSYWHWSIVGAPLVVAPGLGLLVGAWVSREEDADSDPLPDGLDWMLEYGDRWRGT
jgi:cell division protein FtsX